MLDMLQARADDFVQGLRCHEAGLLAEAGRFYRRVIEDDPAHCGGVFLLGLVQAARGDLAAARDFLERAAALDPTVPAHHASLASVLARQGEWEAAAVQSRRALALDPRHAEALNTLGVVHRQMGRPGAAMKCFQQAAAASPFDADAHSNLGVALAEAGRAGEAIHCFRAAVRLRPDRPNAHNNLGAVLADAGDLDAAMACFRAAIALDPCHADAHFSLAATLLAAGNMAEGWPEFEWRWRTPAMAAAGRGFSQPQWRGEAGHGRTLLIHAEQGFGDTLQFCRYAPMAAAQGWRVILEVQPALVRLLGCLPGVGAVVARGTGLPAFDAHCPMLSLPLAFETRLATIPAAPCYLMPPADQQAAWQERLAPYRGVKVGFAWAGNPRATSPGLAAIDRRRSIDAAWLMPLIATPGLDCFSLQKTGEAAPAGMTDFMAEMDDFAATAALIATLDLVISVDTAVAHLAAALGKPVWLLDRFDPCWRWLRGRNDSPWYPTLRIYRQPAAGEWRPVMSAVAEDLAGFARQRSAQDTKPSAE